MEKTPWRKTVDPNFIGTYVLPNDQPINAVIVKVEWKQIKVMGQNKKQAVATFAPNIHFDKPMLLNVTNMKRMERLAGSKYIEDWINIPVTLQREMDKTPTGGSDWALRIATIAPKITSDGKPSKAKLLPDTQAWNSAVEYVQQGNPMENVTKKYDLSPENLILFNQALEVKPEVAEEVKENVGEETQSHPTDEQS
jgi:hypothetical protein